MPDIKIKQAVILAGGEGTRLLPLTKTIPKPMIEFYGKPFVQNLIELLKKEGIEEIVFLAGYLHEKIQEYFGDGSGFGLSIKYSVGDVSFDTGKRLKFAEGMLDKHFLLLYCDNYLPLNLSKLVEFYNQKQLLVSCLIYSNEDGFTKSNIKINEEGVVTLYDKKRDSQELSGVDIGFFIVNKQIVDNMPEDNISFQEIILKLVNMKQLAGIITDYRYCGLSKMERIPIVEKFLKPKKIIFLDRDGVINKRPPKADYVKKWEEFEFIPGSIEAIFYLKKKGYTLYLISNQPGIARGMMTKEDLDSVHKNMKEKLLEGGASIDGIYCCLHGWDDGCKCRKPKPGMFYMAANEHNIDLSKTIYIGDDERDKVAGEAAGIKTYLVTEEKNLLNVVKGLHDETKRQSKQIEDLRNENESLRGQLSNASNTPFPEAPEEVKTDLSQFSVLARLSNFLKKLGF